MKEIYNSMLALLVQVLVNARRAEIVGATLQIDDTLMLEVDVNGKDTIGLSIGDIRITRGDIEELAKNPRDLRGRYNRVKRATEMTVAELKSRNLPLYWNKAWLVAQLAEHRTYSAVARKFGYPSATTIASFAKRNHGIDLQAQFDQKRLDVIKRYNDAKHTDSPMTHVELAREFDVAVATVYRWLHEDELGLTPDPNRVHKRTGRGRPRKNLPPQKSVVAEVVEEEAAPKAS